MEPQRWQEIQDVYLAALTRPPEERLAWLDTACETDPDLRDEVESLLATGGGELLDATLDDLLLLLEDEGGDRPPPPPERAGPYVILEELGRGGMGVVHRARRDDGQYTREVALKLVQPTGDAGEVARRFRRERQILAALEHPNIARLYEAGVAADGRSWLAMELVRGEPIHRYCDRLRLTVGERLALFEQVVGAVEYAHRNLVIHRDLKPSNVLVTAGGEVKLLDFGIAKLLDATEDTAEGDEPLTRADQRLLTPEYASPEQQRGEPLTTASDVYSLGVVLHHLLVGRRPEGAEPPSPSTLRDTEEAARARSTTPGRLRRQLRGELDTIALRALRPAAADRYPTAAALLDDLVRYRTRRPILARPPSWLYRARKLVARNRVAMTAAAAAVIGLVGGLGVALQQARVARQERDLAESVSGFLENIFTSSNPFDRSGERRDTLPVRSFLDQAVERLDTDLAGQPEARARMQRILGSLNEALGAYDRSRTLLESAVEGYRGLGAEHAPEVAFALRDLGRVIHSGGDAAAAEPIYREALDIAAARFGEQSPEVGEIRIQLAGVFLTLRRLDEAEEMLRAGIEANADTVAGGGAKTVENLNLLAVLQYGRGELDGAIATMGRALETSRRVYGPDNPTTAVLSQNLGLTLHRRGRSAEAEPLLRDALRGLERALGPDHPNIGPTMKTLALALDATGREAEADSLFQASIAFTRRVVGEDHPDLATALFDYGSVLMRRGELERARALIDEAVEVSRHTEGPGSPGTGITMGGAAEVRRRQGDPETAERMYREALEVLGKTFPPSHPRMLAARAGLGLSLADQDRRDEAEELLLSVYEDAGTVGDGGVARRDAARSLAEFYEGVADAAEAARWRALAAEGGEA